MKEKHKFEVRSGRVVLTIELERNITILRGDSATGKTTLVEMLQAYETYGRQSGVTVSCDKLCRVLSGVNWELQLNATHDSIVFVDEGSTFVSSLDFARAIQHSDNYYVLVTREDLSTLPYSVNAILELKKTTSRFKRTYNKAYPVYDSQTASNVQMEGVEKLLTEDANSGYQLFTKVGEKYGIVCIPAAGKDNNKQKIIPIARRFEALGYRIYATLGTAKVLKENGIKVIRTNKLEQPAPNLMDLILGHKIDVVIDTPPQGVEHQKDGFVIRRNAIETGVNVLTSLDTAEALATSLENTDLNNLSLIDIATIARR